MKTNILALILMSVFLVNCAPVNSEPQPSTKNAQISEDVPLAKRTCGEFVWCASVCDANFGSLGAEAVKQHVCSKLSTTHHPSNACNTRISADRESARANVQCKESTVDEALGVADPTSTACAASAACRAICDQRFTSVPEIDILRRPVHHTLTTLMLIHENQLKDSARAACMGAPSDYVVKTWGN